MLLQGEGTAVAPLLGCRPGTARPGSHGAGLGVTAPGSGSGAGSVQVAWPWLQLGGASKDHTVPGSALWPLRSSLTLGCLQQRLRLHTQTGAPSEGVWASWPGSASPHAVGAGAQQGCSEERQEWVHLRTETWPRGEQLGNHPCALLAPHRASLPLPKQ